MQVFFYAFCLIVFGIFNISLLLFPKKSKKMPFVLNNKRKNKI